MVLHCFISANTRFKLFVWSKGLNAHLSDDKKQALMIEYWFTEDDLAVYFLRRDNAAR